MKQNKEKQLIKILKRAMTKKHANLWIYGEIRMDTRAALNLVFSLHIWRESQHKNNEKFTFLNTILRKFIPFKVSQDIDQAFISAILVAVTTPGSSQYSENYLGICCNADLLAYIFFLLIVQHLHSGSLHGVFLSMVHYYKDRSKNISLLYIR